MNSFQKGFVDELNKIAALPAMAPLASAALKKIAPHVVPAAANALSRNKGVQPSGGEGVR